MQTSARERIPQESDSFSRCHHNQDASPQWNEQCCERLSRKVASFGAGSSYPDSRATRSAGSSFVGADTCVSNARVAKERSRPGLMRLAAIALGSSVKAGVVATY